MSCSGDPSWVLTERSALVGDGFYDRYRCVRGRNCETLVDIGKRPAKRHCPEAGQTSDRSKI